MVTENDEQVRRNERYLRQTEARDYEEFAGLYGEDEPDVEDPEEEKGGPFGTAHTQYKEHIMFKQNMQQERTWQAAAAEIVTHIMRLYNVDADRAWKLFRDALDTTSAWTEIMRIVAHDVETPEEVLHE